MVFQSTAAFHRLSSCMVHPMKFLASVGLAQACPTKISYLHCDITITYNIIAENLGYKYTYYQEFII